MSNRKGHWGRRSELTSICPRSPINLVNNRNFSESLSLLLKSCENDFHSSSKAAPFCCSKHNSYPPYPSALCERWENASSISNMICIAFLFIVLSTLLSINLRFPSSPLCHVFVVARRAFLLYIIPLTLRPSSTLSSSPLSASLARTQELSAQQTSNLWNKTEWHDLVIDN